MTPSPSDHQKQVLQDDMTTTMKILDVAHTRGLEKEVLAEITSTKTPPFIEEKEKELKENAEIFNLTKELHIFTVFVVSFTVALYAWGILNISSWGWRLFGSLATAVITVFVIRFLLNRYL